MNDINALEKKVTSSIEEFTNINNYNICCSDKSFAFIKDKDSLTIQFDNRGFALEDLSNTLMKARIMGINDINTLMPAIQKRYKVEYFEVTCEKYEDTVFNNVEDLYSYILTLAII